MNDLDRRIDRSAAQRKTLGQLVSERNALAKQARDVAALANPIELQLKEIRAEAAALIAKRDALSNQIADRLEEHQKVVRRTFQEDLVLE